MHLEYNNDTRDALKDMVLDLKSTFKKYNRSTRRQAWDALLSRHGVDQVEKLINNPNQPVIGIPRMRFRDWMEENG